MRGRGFAIAALALPVAAGIAYLRAYGAPNAYPAVNGGALVLAALWIAFAPRAPGRALRRILIVLSLALLYVPLVSGPAIDGVARWLPLGPFTLHAGSLVLPALVMLAADETDHAPGILSIALLAALLQPDMATAAALTLAAFGFADATRDWRYVAFAAVAFVVSLVAAMQGELPAQPFVEHVIWLLARTDPLVALGLLAALVASFFLILVASPGRDVAGKALAGCLFGFAFAGLVSNYPSVLIGYGAAPILGFGLGLGLLAARPYRERSAGGAARGEIAG